MRRWGLPRPGRARDLVKAPGLWKALGVAGFLGVAATGAVIVRSERRRRSYTPEEIRERLHRRLEEAREERS
ncbi:hypothetical protein [Actinomadura hallensis]|uniref:hypothetical protein n=1 Tax=Actinomadura hallensis TaxID=337895 RepID=UPI0011544973|nr:hypothetical protein [Actinomadura hallensis]